ncbi:hypothetical protein [Xenorhabdus cabanillasii]|uniref:Uncharacterized protein n=1 Tax=Xenorhabdus cabanillasii JM26 TaxID=1427517 RepID=W1J646_9GAMM|nr:hypothetical protein [Xenorhabdus cabanillasii]PHM74976.1 hypothetical protein Xcab_04288 [Xenorhabdus cabanillasii JM26]CDL86232.1 conserved membrane hypothetical protein [Xenorhabdus cabanillasii JM26]
MKIKSFLKWVIFIIILMIGLLSIAHLSLMNPDLAGDFNQLMYRWRYFSALWRVLIYILIGVIIWHLWKSGKIPSESQQTFRRIVLAFVLFVLVSEMTIWMNSGE